MARFARKLGPLEAIANAVQPLPGQALAGHSLRFSAKLLRAAIFLSGFSADSQLVDGRSLYEENPTWKADAARRAAPAALPKPLAGQTLICAY